MTTFEVRSEKRDRVYVRAFDHDEARRLHSEDGLSYATIADLMGVSPAAVARVCDPGRRARMEAQTREHYCRSKPECIEEGCGNLVSRSHAVRSGRCQECARRLACEADERDGELRCSKCRAWKPDDEFGREDRAVRRGRRSQCRKCETEQRAAWRRANPVQEQATEAARKRVKRGGSPMAKFVVLLKSEGGWQEKGTVEAATRERAIERVANSEGAWAAVSAGQLREFQVGQTEAFKIVPDDAAPDA